MRRLLWAFIALALIGCQNYQLPEKWKPLKYVVETPFLPEHVGALTISDTVYVKSLKSWKNDKDIEMTARLLHERTHSVRQKEEGIILWLLQYVTSKNFMKYEEQVAWYVEVKYLLDNKRTIKSFNEKFWFYENLEGKLFKNQEEGMRWIDSVKHKKWKPKENIDIYLTPVK